MPAASRREAVGHIYFFWGAGIKIMMHDVKTPFSKRSRSLGKRAPKSRDERTGEQKSFAGKLKNGIRSKKSGNYPISTKISMYP